jgi:SAM-dependent methyltransferase
MPQRKEPRLVLPAGASALRDSHAPPVYNAPPVNFGATAADYGRWRVGFPQSFFKRLFSEEWVHAGDKVLDLGTGTGTIARGLALRGCLATGLDSEQHLLTEAARLDREAATGVTYVEGHAEATGLPAQSFDAVTAGQCWHWFDRPRTATEVGRILKPGGRLVIAHFDWLPMRENVVAMTERLVERHNPAWHLGNNSGIYPPWLADASEAGFVGLETFSFDVDVAYTHEAWRGRIRASAGIGASLGPAEVAAFDHDLAEALARDFSAEPLLVPHRVWALKAEWPGADAAPHRADWLK